MSFYGLLAALVLGVATIVARSNAYASCMRSASKKYAERVASALNKLSAMFGLITLFFVGAYVASKLPMNLPVRVHHNTLMALLGYLMFLGGKWVLVPPRYSTAARRARND